jgi:hypothetical protein
MSKKSSKYETVRWKDANKFRMKLMINVMSIRVRNTDCLLSVRIKRTQILNHVTFVLSVFIKYTLIGQYFYGTNVYIVSLFS